jgi:hypothetical protein
MEARMSEQPEEMLEPNAPAGTPVQEQVAKNAGDVWCAHGVRWTFADVGYVADDALNSEHLGHNDPAMEAGAIPCQPTYASYKAWEILAPVREIEDIQEEGGL